MGHTSPYILIQHNCVFGEYFPDFPGMPGTGTGKVSTVQRGRDTERAGTENNVSEINELRLITKISNFVIEASFWSI